MCSLIYKNQSTTTKQNRTVNGDGDNIFIAKGPLITEKIINGYILFCLLQEIGINC